MKLTKKLIKKLVMESLEESPVGGSPSVDSMTVTDPSSDTGENAVLHKLEDGSFKLQGQGGEITLSPEDMKKIISQYEEAVNFDEEHGTAEESPEETVQEMGADHLREGRVTKSGLQRIIKEEYRKLVKENDGGHLIDGAELTKYFNFDGKYSSPKRVEGGLPPELSGKFYVIINGEKSKIAFPSYQAAEMVFKNPGAKLEKSLDVQPTRFSASRSAEINR